MRRYKILQQSPEFSSNAAYVTNTKRQHSSYVRGSPFFEKRFAYTAVEYLQAFTHKMARKRSQEPPITIWTTNSLARISRVF